MLPIHVKRIWLARAATDMRKSFDSLAALVIDRFRLDPTSGDAFVFFNRNRDRVKVLVWDGQGMWLLAQRPGRGRFRLPYALADADGLGALKVSLSEWLGILETPPENCRRRRQVAPRSGAEAPSPGVKPEVGGESTRRMTRGCTSYSVAG